MPKTNPAVPFKALERITRSDSVPSLNDFLALGRELHAARLDFFVHGVIPAKTRPALYAVILVGNSCRYHRMADDNARAGMEAVADVLGQLAKNPKYWPYVRDELLKFAGLIAEEVKKRNPDDAQQQLAESFDKLTNQQQKLMRFLDERENKRASIRDAMIGTGKQHASKRARKSFLEAISRLNTRLSEHYPHLEIVLDRIAKTIALADLPQKATKQATKATE